MRAPRLRLGMIVGASAGAVAIASGVGAAYACTALSTLAVSRTSSFAGAAVTLTGAGFTANAPVVIRWSPASGTAQGPVLASVLPTSTGHFTTSVKVPGTAVPGEYVISTGQPSKPNVGAGAGALFDVEAAVAPPATPIAPASTGHAARHPTGFSTRPTKGSGPPAWLLAVVFVTGALILTAAGLGVLVLRRLRLALLAIGGRQTGRLAPDTAEPGAEPLPETSDDPTKQPVGAGSGTAPS
ncbi:MAG: hypothetical protein ACRDY2_04250 [Acidimicrobiales bacterium]